MSRYSYKRNALTRAPWALGKPEDLAGQPIGMYHCEFCGEMSGEP